MTDDPTPPSLTSTSGETPSFLPVATVRWGWWDVVYGFGAFLLTLTVSVIAIVAFRIDTTNTDAVGLFSLAAAVLSYAALTTVVVLASRRKGLGSLAADFGLRFRPIDIAIGLAAGLVAKIFAIVLAGLAVSLTNHTPESGNFELSTSALWIVLNGFVIAAIVAPVVEELFFRGLVLRAAHNRVLRRGGTKARAATVAVLASSTGFALLHLYQSTDVTLLIIVGGGAFFLGLINSRISLATGRLGAAIIAHVFFNGSSVLVALLLAP